jgi:glycosyltransferase involved in cell wall biosynthesis
VSSVRPPQICFVAHNAYGAIAGGTSGHIGGVERQTSLMAKWLAARGHRVSMLTWDEGQTDGVEIEGVRVFAICPRTAGLPGLRFVWPRWSSLVAAMKRADADVYYQNCAEYVTGQAGLWCRRHGRKFVYSVASDPDCDKALPKMHSVRERVLYRYGLKVADAVIVQTTTQQNMLRSNFGVDSVVLPMPCPGPSAGERVDWAKRRNGSCHVLWVGRIYRVKRLDRLLDIAQLCPDLQFDVIGQTADDDYARDVCKRATKMDNVTLHGSVPRDCVSEFYQNAAVLCCTSDFEGFPNTFLEAWSHGVPVVSTHDPDGLIVRKGLGKVGKNVPELADGIRQVLASDEERQKIFHTAREYYLANHTVDVAMKRFEQVLVNAASIVT